MSGLERALIRMDWLLDKLTIALLLLLNVVVGLQVFSRYVLNHSLYWSEEVARYLFIYLVFLGAAIVLRRNGHIQVSFFVERLPAPLRRTVAVLVDLLLLWFVGVVSVQSVRLALMVWTVPTAALEIPWTIVYLGIVCGTAAMTVGVVGSLYSRLRRTDRPA